MNEKEMFYRQGDIALTYGYTPADFKRLRASDEPVEAHAVLTVSTFAGITLTEKQCRTLGEQLLRAAEHMAVDASRVRYLRTLDGTR